MHKTILISTILALSLANFAHDNRVVADDQPLHRESKMVAVDWQSSPSNEFEEKTNRSVAKPIVDQSPIIDEAVEHTVYQSPSVYLDRPENRANSNTIFEGFKQAGQNLSQATGQTLRDLGNGTKNVAQGIYDGTADTLSAGATAIDNTVDNTFNIGNEEYFNQRAQQNNSSQNQVNLPPPPINSQRTAFENNPNSQNFATTQANNEQFSNAPENNSQQFNQQQIEQSQFAQQQFAQQQGQQNETPAVPRRPLDTGISTNFGNNQSNRNYNPDDSRLAPVQNQRQSNFANNGSRGNGYSNQDPYQNNPGQNNSVLNNQNGYPNQNRSNLITPPPIGQYADGSSQLPTWSTPSFNQVADNQQNTQGNQGYYNQGGGPTTQQAGRPVTQANSQWPPSQTVSNTGWGDSQTTTNQSKQNNDNLASQNDSNQNQSMSPTNNGNLVWILAGFSLFGNVYGWTALLEMRNKYRASLRRSPVNLRDGGH